MTDWIKVILVAVVVVAVYAWAGTMDFETYCKVDPTLEVCQ